MGSKRIIMHVDMDAFFASVEQLDHPEYRGRPVIVGGLSGRGVVSTCSYEARKFGVHSAMPMATARRLCPQAVYVQGRYHRYVELSRQIRSIFQIFSPVVEPLSIDEAFLDLTGMEALVEDATTLGEKIKQVIRQQTGLTASVGIAPNKFLAKLASDLQKPDGLVIISQEEAADFIAPLPLSRVFGLGRRSVAALENLGLRTIGQLAACPVSLLQPVLGKQAEEIRNRARGLDDRPVVPDEQRKSLGKETTFGADLMGKGPVPADHPQPDCGGTGAAGRGTAGTDPPAGGPGKLAGTGTAPGSQRQPPDTRWQCGPGSGWQRPGPEAGPGPGRIETAVRGRHHP